MSVQNTWTCITVDTQHLADLSSRQVQNLYEVAISTTAHSVPREEKYSATGHTSFSWVYSLKYEQLYGLKGSTSYKLNGTQVSVIISIEVEGRPRPLTLISTLISPFCRSEIDSLTFCQQGGVNLHSTNSKGKAGNKKYPDKLFLIPSR